VCLEVCRYVACSSRDSSSLYVHKVYTHIDKYIHVCICINIYIYIYMCVYIYVFIYMHVYIKIWLYIYICI